MPLSQHPLYLVVFAVVLLATSGLGQLALGPGAACGALRTCVAHGLFGFLVLSAGFGLALLVNVTRFEITFFIASTLTILGVAAWTASFIRRPRVRSAMLVAWCAGVVALAGVSWLPVDVNATDAVSYAFLTSTGLHGQWVDTNLEGSPLADLAGTNPFWAGSRGAALSLVWPWAALGWGVGPQTVAEVGQWFVLLSLALMTDVLRAAEAPLLARLLLAAGGLGAFSEEAALGGGQIGQAFGMLGVTIALWLDRYLVAGWARLVALGLVGYVVATGYTEFLAALPLYVGCLFLLRPRGWRSVAAACGAITLGVLLAELTTRGVMLDYLLNQVRISPTARAFPDDPRNALDVWQWVVLQRPFSRWMFLLLVPATVYVVRVARRRGGARRSPGVRDAGVCVGAVALLGVLTSVALHTDNPNYATFKMSGWVGPVLLLGGWALCGTLRRRAQQFVSGGLLLLASYRTLGLIWSVASLTAANLPTLGRPVDWYLAGAGAECSVHVLGLQPTRMATETAIAESAAARLNCTIDTRPS